MVAPTEKSNDTIQIVITRSCDLFVCSNCTQLLPFRHDELHMTPDVFRQALRSLAGWPGIYGIFGGNPCSHPKFAELMQILREEVPNQHQRGLWSNNLLGHGSLVRDVFYPGARFNLNAHGSDAVAREMDRWVPGKRIPTSQARLSWHSAILVDWRDVGLTQAEWVQARESCDINRTWSAAIFERDAQAVAYFCEVGGALDAMRGQSHGLPATPGWWRQPMAAFQSQVKICDQGCGIPLRQLGHRDRDATYDASPSFIPLTEVHRGRVSVQPLTALAAATERPTDYQGLRSAKP